MVSSSSSHSPDPKILDGKAVAAEIRAEIAQEVDDRTRRGLRPPGLAAVLVGDDPASRVYVGSKTRACAKAGMVSRTVSLPAAILQEELEAKLAELNADPEIHGILVQLPLPGAEDRPAGAPLLDPARALQQVDPEKDVDGFHAVNVGRLWRGEDGFVPATPAGSLELLRRRDIPGTGQRAVVVGRSLIVGKPMAGLLLNQSATVTVCHSRTRDLAAVCRQADILIAAVGRTAMLGPDHIAEGAVVIDVGMNRITDEDELERLFPGDEGRRKTFAKRGSALTGDVDFTAVREKVSAITPVPGGVGPLTVAMVLSNTLKAARRRDGAP